MKVYLATAWKNPHITVLKAAIEDQGHSCYHFLDSGLELDYNKIMPGLRERPAKIQVEHLYNPLVLQATAINVKALRESDVFILAEPASKGSYTEFGLAVALNKPTILFVTDEYELGVMDGLFDTTVNSVEWLLTLLSSRWAPNNDSSCRYPHECSVSGSTDDQ